MFCVIGGQGYDRSKIASICISRCTCIALSVPRIEISETEEKQVIKCIVAKPQLCGDKCRTPKKANKKKVVAPETKNSDSNGTMNPTPIL